MFLGLIICAPGKQMMIKFLAISVEHKAFLLFVVNSLMLGVYPETSLIVSNNCSFMVWPVISVVGSPSSGSGFALQTGESQVFSTSSPWNVRLWGRTGCSESSDGKFTCVTGGCTNRTLNCNGEYATTSVTIAEFALNQRTVLLDFYDVVLVDGYNLPILISPHGSNSCRETGCAADLNRFCPPELQLLSGDGDIIACQGPCRVFRTNEYCCINDSAPCKPTNYSQVFKKACPSAYSYPQDYETSLFSCLSGADYNVTFCPSVTSLSTIPGSPPSHQGVGPSPAPSQGTPTSPSSGQGTPTSPSSGQGTPTSIIAGVVSAMVLLILVIGLIILRKIKKEKRNKDLRELLTLEGHTETHWHKRNGAKNHDLRLFSYETILSATHTFSSDNKLGEGGFGSVFKGKTSEGQDLAVKLLSRQSGQGLLEFKTELILISKLQHVNLVKLHGLCIHGDDKMIIYDYMPNKSLDFFLFNPLKKEQLNWPRRFSIIEGIAQGLLYLHKYSRLKIIHRDLKPSNILLDENMNAKISDFGLARVFEQNIDEANTNRRVGTYGYMAPEYAMQGIFSVKSDVYSFGVLVLEIVSGRKNNCFHQMEGPLNLVEYAWELWRNDLALQLTDPTLQDSCITQQLQRCIHIALLCVENRAVDRPSIEDVILMLKSETMSLPTPKNPSFIARNFVQAEVKRSTRDTSTQNDATLSEIEGR